MLRKHIKIEPQIFYYYCDIYGMAVFQDAVNNGKYSFFRDTALPTVGFKNLKRDSAPKVCRVNFEETAEKMIELLYNHPSVCYYTIFNEGWGQYDAAYVYEKLKALDNSRIYDTASGWFGEQKSDVVSEHVYFKPIKLKPSADQPLILSEFGGYSYKPEGHVFNVKQTYGYRFFENRAEFENALIKLYEDEVIPLVKKGLCAAVYTQVSDVEDETNGLLSYDRKVTKVGADRMLKIADALYREIQK